MPARQKLHASSEEEPVEAQPNGQRVSGGRIRTAFLKAVAPYREDLVVVECMFTWYRRERQQRLNVVLKET